MRIILHIGAEKTGTSSIQRWMRDHYHDLLRAGIYYPLDLCYENHLCLPACAIGKPDHDEVTSEAYSFIAKLGYSDMKAYVLDALTMKITSEDVHTLLLSNEHLHSRVSAPDQINNIREILQSISDNIHIIIYLRRQDRMAVSLYSTKIKYGATDSESILPQGTPYYYDFKAILSQWEAAFGPQAINVRVFEDAGKGSTIVEDILSVFDLRVDSDTTSPRVNPSISADAQFLISRLNRHLVESSADPNLAIEVRSKMVSFMETNFSGPGRSISRSQAIEFVNRFSASNEAVRRRYLPDRASLFDDEFEVYQEHYVYEPSTDHAIDMQLAFLINQMKL